MQVESVGKRKGILVSELMKMYLKTGKTVYIKASNFFQEQQNKGISEHLHVIENPDKWYKNVSRKSAIFMERMTRKGHPLYANNGNCLIGAPRDPETK